MKYGMITVAAAIPGVRVADCAYNEEQLGSMLAAAEEQSAEVLVCPELSVTGYSCQDLFGQRLLLDEAEAAVGRLLERTQQADVTLIVGVPVECGNLLLNCAAVMQHGRLLGLVPKTYLPNYSEFYEKRWFASAQDLSDTEMTYAGRQVMLTSRPTLFKTADGVLFGVEICEDVWAPAPPSNHLALAGADLIFNLSASDELIGKHDYLLSLLMQQSARTMTGYVYSGCGYGESTQDVVYGGNAIICENGKLVATAERFKMEPQLVVQQVDVERLRTERRTNSTYVNARRGYTARTVELEPVKEKPFRMMREIDAHPFIPKTGDMARSCEEIFNIQVMGLAKRIEHTHSHHVVVGISGGLDSTLALLVCVRTFDKLRLDRRGIIGVTMPGFGTTDRTYRNALTMMETLGVEVREISIAKAVMQHFEDIGQSADVHDVTYENSQARERTQILMDVANKEGGLVIGTGDLSELALGWATYNGDHMSMYGVNAGIPKTLIRHLVSYVADTHRQADDQRGRAVYDVLMDVIDTPISPELIPADAQGHIKQKTEDLVGPYELHDFFLYYFLRFGFRPKKIFMLAHHAFAGAYDDATIKKWLTTFVRRFFAQQFKRSCLPDGPKVGSVSLSPRGDWRMPTDASSAQWLAECEKL